MKKYASCIVALALVAICYPFARPHTLSKSDAVALAARFSFKKVPITEATNHPPYKEARQVHPSLTRIAAWVSSLGAAATLADLDGDGLANDLISVDPRTDVVAIAPVPGTGDRYSLIAYARENWKGAAYDIEALAPMGTLAGDFNEDGSIDVLVYFWGRTPVLLLRDAESTKSPLSQKSFRMVELSNLGERWYSNAAVQDDLDGDGHLDLLIGNYYHDGARVLDAKATGSETLHAGKAKALNGGQKHFFLYDASQGDGSNRFRHVPNVLPEEIGRGWSLAISTADLDGDLLPEIYIANDFGPDRLLHNRSTPGELNFALLSGVRDFTTPKSCVLGDDSFKGMGVDFGDINGDGHLDIFVSNIATKFGLTESHFLWLNTGETNRMKEGIAPFVHGSEKLGLSRSGFSWEARLADFDNDGVLEAVQACGFIKGKINRWPELQALGTSNDQIVQNPNFWPSFKPGADLSGNDCNPFFVVAADGRYYDITPALGLNQPMVTRGLAIADVDHDGRLDYVAANQWGPSYYFKNESPNERQSVSNTSLGLQLVHANGTPAIGAVARLTLPSGRKLISRIDGGGGHSGRRSAELHFGLGLLNTPVSVEIDWRDLSGNPRHHAVQLAPGWHTIELRAASPQIALHEETSRERIR
ncbi:MAG TPA: VCBS repeat-containing protein [Verrucomicrobiae bacterium]